MMQKVFQAIRALLGEQGCDLVAALAEGRAMMTNNLGSLRQENVRGFGDADRGFHLIINGPGGTPQHLVKCRPTPEASSPSTEGRAYRLFREDPRSSELVPRSASRIEGGIHLQYLEFQAGLRADHLIPKLSVDGLHRLSERVMDAADILALVYMDSTVPGPGEALTHRVALARVFDSATEYGLLPTSLAERILEDSGVKQLEPVPQHRDLWPENLFVDESQQIKIIDFDSYGTTTVPLIDACHWARTCSLQYWPELCRSGWISAALEQQPVRDLAATVLQRASPTARYEQKLWMPLMLCYLVDITVHTIQRGSPEEFWEPMKEELDASLSLYAAGATIPW